MQLKKNKNYILQEYKVIFLMMNIFVKSLYIVFPRKKVNMMFLMRKIIIILMKMIKKVQKQYLKKFGFYIT